MIKSQPLRRQKSEQNPPPNPTRPVSSSTVSEEENEPFVVCENKVFNLDEDVLFIIGCSIKTYFE